MATMFFWCASAYIGIGQTGKHAKLELTERLHQKLLIRFKMNQPLIQFSLISRSCMIIPSLPSMDVDQC
ncbi:hypothetical protein PILCRDRAFT_815667 [Piloderma croceum F 1598]|uniref:Uncharacterized protein n=1 Tax=Piloderma croceum (strain F 1598) TaxID=765440 RepID=A0A0C3G984_PILCF|nr:hypothetical protein PILCRDRAFT_815667 [Piloderma croceum F 1598]